MASPRITLKTLFQLEWDGKTEQFLREEGLLCDFSNSICPKCHKGNFRLIKDKHRINDGKSWICSEKKNGCYHKKSIREGSFFSGSHVKKPFCIIMKILYMWCLKFTPEMVLQEIQPLSSTTLMEWYQFCRAVCVDVLQGTEDGIGGPGHIVEIGESNFGERKGKKGTEVETHWYFGGIDRETKDLFLVPCLDDKRNIATLFPIIKRWVKPGTTIITDCWFAYCSLEENYKDVADDDKLHFVGPDTGPYVNVIETTWRVVKANLPKTGTRTHLYQSYFFEYVFRKRFFTRGSDRFRVFLAKIKSLYPVDTPACPINVPVNLTTPEPSQSTSCSTDLHDMPGPEKRPKL